jgi:predicted metal-dependent hydrolase
VSVRLTRNISLNWQLIHAPKLVIDYVILHELLHTQIPNHTQRFWVHLAAKAPQFRQAIQWLNVNKPVIS